MNKYRIEIRKMLVAEYQKVRRTTSWDSVEDSVVKIALDADLFSVCTFDKEQIIGIGRVIGDGAIYFYIQDVIVIPEYKNRGIGQLIMDNIELFINENANNISFIGLMAADGVKGFYHKLGYLERPENRPEMYKMIKK